MSIHEGHRQRLKQRFADHGERVFDDHQLLELMLFYAVPQGDVNPLAHRLINHFGSFAAVLDASPADLRQVKGVGEHTALYLSMFPQVMRRYLASRAGHEDKVCSVEDAGEYLLPYFFGAKSELLYLLCLDAKGRVLSCRRLAEGSLNRVLMDTRLVIETAMDDRATSVVLAHNHVSGLAVPSEADVKLTLQLIPLLRALDIELLDHLVVADGEFVSMVRSGLIPPPRNSGV